MSKTPYELHKESPWDGNLDAAAHVSDGEKSMGATMRQIVQARGAESVGDTKRTYAAPNSETWLECDGTTVAAVDYPDLAALPAVKRMSSDGIAGITNLTSNSLSLQATSAAYRHAKVIEHNNRYHFLAHSVAEILSLDKADDISASAESKVSLSRIPVLTGDSSSSSKQPFATDGNVHVIAMEYNSSADNVQVAVTTDFVNFNYYTVESDTSTMRPYALWFDENDGCFYIIIYKSSTDITLHKSPDAGMSWVEVQSLPFAAFDTGTFSNGARWFDASGTVYIYEEWKTNKVNYAAVSLNSVVTAGRVEQLGDKLFLFDANDSSVGEVDNKNGWYLGARSEFVGGVEDAKIFGGSLLVVNSTGTLFSSTDNQTYLAVATLPDAQDAISIHLNKISDSRCIAVVKRTEGSTAYQFDLVRSPYDRLILPPIAEQDGLVTYIKAK